LFLFDLFRSFLPLHNPIGFGASDFIEFALAGILVILILFWRHIVRAAVFLAGRPRASMAVLFILPVAMRLALLPHYPAPTPSGSDDFSYLLLGDTLRHFRLANPVHPMHQFFESIFVLQEPSYSSIFPLGQGIVLTLGWAGVLLSGGLACALVYWMLRAYVPPIWALLGGLIAVAEFGPLCGWTNDYWGGFLSACAGCLVFGALRRGFRYDLLLGIGMAVQWLTRPFECVLLAIVAALWLRRVPRLALIPIVATLGLTALQNHAVTGSWTTMPYMESRFQYGVPAAFTFQPNPVPHRTLTPEQRLDYEAQVSAHDSSGNYWQRLIRRGEFYRFFLLVPLFFTPLTSRFRWGLATILFFALGTNFYPYFYPHYIAALLCLFILTAVSGLSTVPRELARATVLLCAAHALFWYGLHLFAPGNLRVAISRFENWDFINLGDPEGRIDVNRRLDRENGQQLVFVRYGPAHGFHEWIHNRADIDGARVVWAADLGPDANQALRRYYPQRKAWILEPDAHPPRLITYP
jgi:hypothetical protein